MRAMKLSIGVAMAAVLAAGEAHAQSCTGVPTRDRQIAIMGDLLLTDGASGYGVAASKNFRGPWSVRGGYTLTSHDGSGANGNGVDVNAAYELKLRQLPRMSVCPMAGFGYSWMSEAGQNVSSSVIPVGIGFGRNVVDGPKFDVMAYGVPQFTHVRSRVEVPAFGIDATSSDNAFGGTVGARVSSAAFFGGASVSFSSLEGSDPVFGVTVGWMIGGARQPVQASRSKAASTKSSVKKSPAKAAAKKSPAKPAPKKAPAKPAPKKN